MNWVVEVFCPVANSNRLSERTVAMFRLPLLLCLSLSAPVVPVVQVDLVNQAGLRVREVLVLLVVLMVLVVLVVLFLVLCLFLVALADLVVPAGLLVRSGQSAPVRLSVRCLAVLAGLADQSVPAVLGVLVALLLFLFLFLVVLVVRAVPLLRLRQLLHVVQPDRLARLLL